MRKGLVVFLLINALVLTFFIHSVFTLLTLLFENASADAISHSELPAPNSTLIGTRPQLIPKIIHQTYKSTTIPAHWRAAQQSCIDLHPDYDYKLWTDKRSRELIRTEYPWFLDTFDGYAYPIQRADAIRYFVLAHFGGVYIDLDDGCNRRLDPLLSYTAWVRRTKPTGISNDVMGAVRQHPFLLRVTESLQQYDRKWFLPYITIMYSTGPLFLSVVWKQWMSENSDRARDWDGRVRVLMTAEYNNNPWSFFQHYRGSSWHGKDARLIFWMGRNWMMLTTAGFILAGIVGMILWRLYGRILLLGSHGGLTIRGDGAGLTTLARRCGRISGNLLSRLPRTWTRTRARSRARSRSPSPPTPWRPWSGGVGSRKPRYELVDQSHP